MKKLLGIVMLVAVCIVPLVQAYTSEEIRDGLDRREVIIVEMNTGIKYMAESTIGMDPTAKIWVCSKIVTVTEADRTITIITVMPGLQAPGVNGVNLPTFDYPND